MNINQLTLSIASFVIFILGVVSRRYGVTSVMVMVTLLVHICLSQADDPFPYGCLLSITTFIVLLILHGKASGKSSLLYRYSPYNPNSRIPVVWKLAILLLSIIFILIAVIGFLLEKR